MMIDRGQQSLYIRYTYLHLPFCFWNKCMVHAGTKDSKIPSPKKQKRVKKSFPKFQMGLRFVLTNRHQLYKQKTRWWFQIFFIFTTIWERWTQFGEHIFQMGWFNHQPEEIWKQATNTPHHKTVTHRRLVELKDLPSCRPESIPADTPYAKIGSLKDVVWKAQVVVWQDVRASCHRWILLKTPESWRKMFEVFWCINPVFRWWQLKYFFFHPEAWGRWTQFDAYFSNGLVQPPTSCFQRWCLKGSFLEQTVANNISRTSLRHRMQYTKPGKKRQNLQLNQLRCGLLRVNESSPKIIGPSKLASFWGP